jgi:Fe-S oxidoreductase
LRSDGAAKAVSAHALLFEEFLVREAEAGLLRLPLGPVDSKAVVHGHCHQKSFGAFKPVEQALRLVPELKVEMIESSCCGMAGAFGYGADTYQASMEMAELSLLPAVRGADAAALIVADGTSCRHQIADGTDRAALHVARVLAMSLDNAPSRP